MEGLHGPLFCQDRRRLPSSLIRRTGTSHTPLSVIKAPESSVPGMGGVTWNPINGSGVNSLPVTSSGLIRLAIASSSPQVLYAQLANSSDNSLLGIYKTSD